MLRTIFSLAATVAFCGAANAQTTPPTHLTRTAAATLPAPELITRLLGGLGELVTEVQRPSLTRFPGPQHLTDLSFAMAAKAGGNFNMCEATVIHVAFDPVDERLSFGNVDTVTRPEGIRTETVFKVVGDTSKTQISSVKLDTDRLTALCRKAGRVLTPAEDVFNQQSFFPLRAWVTRYGEGNSAWIAAYSLQKAIAAAKAKAGTAPTCAHVRPLEACDAAASLARLSLENLTEAAVTVCKTGGLCVSGSFFLPVKDNAELWRVDLEVEELPSIHDGEGIGPLRKIEVVPRGAIFEVVSVTHEFGLEISASLEMRKKWKLDVPVCTAAVYVHSQAAHHTKTDQSVIACRQGAGAWTLSTMIQEGPGGLLQDIEAKLTVNTLRTMTVQEGQQLDALLSRETLYKEEARETGKVRLGPPVHAMEIKSGEGNVAAQWNERLLGELGAVADLVLGVRK